MFFAAIGVTPHISPVRSLSITRSCHFARGDRILPTSEGSTKAGDEIIPTFKPAIVVRGDGITVDFKGSRILGSPETIPPDLRRGLGILVEGKNVTIKNAVVRGYRVGLMARNAPGLKLIDCDFSYNYKQHLKSTLDREDTSDWQSYHHNEHDEWLRYGAAISLWDCDRFQLKRLKAEGGQCGLMLTRCNHGSVTDCDFSFLSGLGIGMYRSSRNVIAHNRIDWDVRGFSYGFYNRGQDSAGILVFEQCSHNTFASNSVTHGGDGFFLWAGQHTMDTGEGGCNDNDVRSNNFSYAVTNGVEATFSRNRFEYNTVRECWHGVWDGYSYNTRIAGNKIEDCEIGVATEHGQDNQIVGNLFKDNGTAIRLWADGKPDPNWGYGKVRDVRSRDTEIEGNMFSLNADAVSATSSTGVRQVGNVVGVKGPAWSLWKHPAEQMRGWRYILIDDWGPYDFKRPLLWPREDPRPGRKRFEILGPAGKWRVVSAEGVSHLSATHGSVPGFLEVDPLGGDVRLNLEYTGRETTDYRGVVTTAGRHVRFGYSHFFLPIDWTVSFYRWSRSENQNDPHAAPAAFSQVIQSAPIKTIKTDRLDFAGAALVPGLPNDHYATSARGFFSVPDAQYEVDLTTDDGARVWLDGKPLITDAWHYQGPTEYVRTLHLGKGEHVLQVEHFQIDGYAELKVDVKRVD